MIDRRTVGRASTRVLALLAVALAFAVLPGAAAAEGAPAWRVVAMPFPTNFVPGSVGTATEPPGLEIVARNVGAAPTTGPFKANLSLPPGIFPSFKQKPFGSFAVGESLSCSATNHSATCTGAGPVFPGQKVEVVVPVEVSATARASGIAEARLEGGGAPATFGAAATTVGAAPPPFGFLTGPAGAFAAATGSDGADVTQAGSHPEQLAIEMAFQTVGSQEPGDTMRVPDGGIRDVEADLPEGLVVNPEATPKCSEEQLESRACPDSTQIGTVSLTISVSGLPRTSILPLYNLIPPPGTPAELGAEPTEGVFVHLMGRVRSDGDFGFSTAIRSIPAKIGVLATEATLWGDPSAESHDHARGACLAQGGSCPVERLDSPFLTMPSSCRPSLPIALRADSWGHPGEFSERHLPVGEPAGVDGCNRLEFAPSLTVLPSTEVADSPGGLELRIHVPQREDPGGLATANLEDAAITLSPGLVINPSAGAGLGACQPGQIGLLTAPGSPPRFNTTPAECPDDATLGTVELATPIVNHPLVGSVYLAEPQRNPFGSLLAVYLSIDDPATGIVAKLAGEIDPDPRDGRLTFRIAGAPQLPLETIALSFFRGPRAIFTTPLACGSYEATSLLTPWSSPEGADASPLDSFAIGETPGGGACPLAEAEAPHRPRFTAGTVSSEAGAYSPFIFSVNRADGSQRLRSFDVSLPRGLTARLAGVPVCSDAEIPACPAGSRVGSVTVAAGAGPTPLQLSGAAYLGGPYRGAPFSLTFAVPAVAGPIDLGEILTRVALRVDPTTGRVEAVSDPLPAILAGVPLDVRGVTVTLDRARFALNPTSCDPAVLATTAESLGGQAVALSSRFQVGGCSRLAFRPRLSAHLRGSPRRGAHPALRVALGARGGDASLKRVAVTLPAAELLDIRHVRAVCSRDRYAADECPGGSVVGRVRVRTPLLARPLEGTVYLRSGPGRLPDLAISLRGEVEIDLLARVVAVEGRLRVVVDGLPDAPVSKFVLVMKGGRGGLLVNAGGLCARLPLVATSLLSQSGKSTELEPHLDINCS